MVKVDDLCLALQIVTFTIPYCLRSTENWLQFRLITFPHHAHHQTLPGRHRSPLRADRRRRRRRRTFCRAGRRACSRRRRRGRTLARTSCPAGRGDRAGRRGRRGGRRRQGSWWPRGGGRCTGTAWEVKTVFCKDAPG